MKTVDEITTELTKRIEVLQSIKKQLSDANITPDLELERMVETYNGILKFIKS